MKLHDHSKSHAHKPTRSHSLSTHSRNSIKSNTNSHESREKLLKSKGNHENFERKRSSHDDNNNKLNDEHEKGKNDDEKVNGKDKVGEEVKDGRNGRDEKGGKRSKKLDEESDVGSKDKRHRHHHRHRHDRHERRHKKSRSRRHDDSRSRSRSEGREVKKKRKHRDRSREKKYDSEDSLEREDSKSRRKHRKHRSKRSRHSRTRSRSDRHRRRRRSRSESRDSRRRRRKSKRSRSKSNHSGRSKSETKPRASRFSKPKDEKSKDKEDFEIVKAQVLGQQNLASLLASMQQISSGQNPNDPAERLKRELYIGGLPVGMTAPALIAFLNQAMQQYGFALSPGNSVTRATMSADGTYGFVEFRSVQETDCAMLNLNGIPILGNSTKFGRPRNYTGDGPTTGTFNANIPALPSLNISRDSAEKLMKELENKLNVTSMQTGLLQNLSMVSNVVKVDNMVTKEMLHQFSELKEIGEEIVEECGNFGKVLQVRMPEFVPSESIMQTLTGEEEVKTEGELSVYVQMDSVDSATNVIESLNGRTFDERNLVAQYVSEKEFLKLPKTSTSCIPRSQLLNFTDHD